MKYFLLLIFAAGIGIFFYLKANGFDAAKGKPLFDQEQTEEQPKTAVYSYVSAQRGDFFTVQQDGLSNRIFHVIGILCPNMDPKSNSREIWGDRKAEDLVSVAGLALEMAKTFASRPGSRFSVRKKTIIEGREILEGDVFSPEGEALAQLLIEEGLAMNDPDSEINYFACEERAKEREIGLWKQEVPLQKRIICHVSMTQQVIDRQTNSQKASMTDDILEKSQSEERKVKVLVTLDSDYPVYQPYPIEINCAFAMQETKGSGEDGLEVSDLSEIEKFSEEHVFSVFPTNISLYSSSFEMTRLTRGGRTFRQGRACAKGMVEVYCGETLLKEEVKEF